MAPPKRHPSFAEALKLLNAEGWHDKKIGDAFGISAVAIAKHRVNHGIPALSSKYSPKIDTGRAAELWGQKASDSEIAEEFGATQSGVTRWRHRHGLPAHQEHLVMATTIKRRIRDMTRLGASRDQIRAETNVSLKSISRIRKTVDGPGVRKPGRNNATIRAHIMQDPRIMQRIERAVGRELPTDIRHDAISEMYTAVLSGLLSPELIEEQAPKFRSRAFEINYGRYADTSLDADRGGWTLGDMIEDEDALAFADGFDNDD